MEAIAAERNRNNSAFRSVVHYVGVFPNVFPLCFKALFYLLALHLIHLKHKVFCPSFSFLYDHQSPAYHYYKEKVEEYVSASQSSSVPAAESRTEIQRQPTLQLQGIPSPLKAACQPQIHESETPPVKRKRKSRWGSEDDKVELPLPSIVVPPEINVPDPNAPSLSGT